MVGTGASQQHCFHPGETRGDRAHGGTRQLSDPRSLGAETRIVPPRRHL